jgi:hypothetical protein
MQRIFTVHPGELCEGSTATVAKEECLQRMIFFDEKSLHAATVA